LEQEKTSRDKQIDALNEDISRSDENIAKLNKERKNLNESLEERTEQLQAAEDKANSLNKAKNKVESQLKDVSFFILMLLLITQWEKAVFRRNWVREPILAGKKFCRRPLD